MRKLSEKKNGGDCRTQGSYFVSAINSQTISAGSEVDVLAVWRLASKRSGRDEEDNSTQRGGSGHRKTQRVTGAEEGHGFQAWVCEIAKINP